MNYTYITHAVIRMLASIQASLYTQIIRWYQNHLYVQRKLADKPKKKRKQSLSVDSEDEEAIQSHLHELKMEVKKKKADDEKVARLMSLTYVSRNREILALSASTRVGTALKEYPCLMKPIFVSKI